MKSVIRISFCFALFQISFVSCADKPKGSSATAPATAKPSQNDGSASTLPPKSQPTPSTQPTLPNSQIAWDGTTLAGTEKIMIIPMD